MLMIFLLWSSKFVVRRSLFAGSSIDALSIATGFEELVKEMWIVCEDRGAPHAACLGAPSPPNVTQAGHGTSKQLRRVMIDVGNEGD
jgi:hypothetical protein